MQQYNSKKELVKKCDNRNKTNKTKIKMEEIIKYKYPFTYDYFDYKFSDL